MATLDSITAAKWAWRSDNSWTVYDAAMNLKLEKEYLKGVLKIKVDDERFVDVSLTVYTTSLARYSHLESQDQVLALLRRV